MIELLNIDCMEYMAGCSDNSFDAIITDPPYYKVKGEQWDRQWDDPDKFLKWVSALCGEFARILKPNGSLYIFASPQMAGRVECVVREKLNVLNHIVWRKGASGLSVRGWSQKARKESLRQFIPQTERIIFAEHYNSDNTAKGEAGYLAKCDELRGFVFEPIRNYLSSEWAAAGLKNEDANIACSTKSMAARHYFSCSQWCLPTKEHYLALQRYANKSGGEYLRREYEDLRREYEDLRREYDDLRREYEDLRREYEDLRRPFTVTPKVQYGDVWDFAPVTAYKGKHPCEKPQALLMHILQSSVKRGSIVFDPFSGSGSMAIASHYFGCDFIGCELDPDYFAAAKERFDLETRQVALL